MTDITKLLELKTKYDETMSQINTLNAQASVVRTELLKTCTHPTTVKKHKYYPGSYYDKGETKYWDECTLCGKKLNQYETSSGSYG